MGLFRPTPQEMAAVRALRDAEAELERVSEQDRQQPDDDAWSAANDAVWAAREDVPWWRR